MKMTEKIDLLEKEKEDANNSCVLAQAKLVHLLLTNKDTQLKVNEQLRNEIYTLKKQTPRIKEYSLESLKSNVEVRPISRNYALEKKYQTIDYMPQREEYDYDKQLMNLQMNKRTIEDSYNKLMGKGPKTIEQRKLKGKLEADLEGIERDINELKKARRLAKD